MNSIASLIVSVTPLALPPGMENLTTLTAWVTGLVAFALFVAFLISIGKTGLEALTRGQFTGGAASIIILICAIALGAASAIFTTFSATS